MQILILYSNRKKGELVSLATLLYERQIQFNPVEIPQNWNILDSETLINHIKDHTHSMFVVDSEDLDNHNFVFAAGFCLGSHEKTYLLDTQGNLFPKTWKSQFQIYQTFGEFVEALFEEKVRWEKHLERLAAKDELLRQGIEVSNSSFLECVLKGAVEPVELFLKAGFSANSFDKKGVPLLCLAVRNHHISVMKLLLDKGADIDQKSMDRDNSALMDAAAEGNVEVVKELIQRGAKIDGQSRNGQTALVLSIGKGDDQCAKLLIEAGANPFLEDKLGMSAAKYAQLFGRQEVLSWIESSRTST